PTHSQPSAYAPRTPDRYRTRRTWSRSWLGPSTPPRPSPRSRRGRSRRRPRPACRRGWTGPHGGATRRTPCSTPNRGRRAVASRVGPRASRKRPNWRARWRRSEPCSVRCSWRCRHTRNHRREERAMATSDAIVVGEDWISEHYFATDGKQSFQRHVADRRKAWDAEHSDGHGTARSRFLAFRSTYLSTLARLSDAHTGNVRARDDLRDLHAHVLSVLGYDSPALH